MPKVLYFHHDSSDVGRISLLIDKCFDKSKLSREIFSDESLKKVESVIPDLVLLESTASSKSAVDFCAKIKTDVKLKDIPVIVIENENTFSRDKSKLLKAGADAVLDENSEEKELIAQIKVMLEIKQVSNQLAAEKSEISKIVIAKLREILVANSRHELEIEERKQSEEALRKSEEQYRALMEQASDGIFVSDSNGRIINVNTKGCEMLGYTREEITKMNIRDLLATDQESDDKSAYNVLNEGKILRLEGNLLGKNNQTLRVEISVKKISDGRLQGIVHDISERKRNEEYLRQSEARLRNILHTAIDGFCVMDREGNFTYVNEAFCNISGYTANEIPGMNLRDLECIETQDETRKHIEQVIEFGSTIFETKHKRKNGEIIDVEISTTWQEQENSFYAFINDITEKKKNLDKIHESEEKYRNLFEKSKDAFLIIENEQFVDCNQATIDMLGYSDRSQILKLHPSRLSPEKQPDGRYSIEKADEMMKIAVEKGSNRFEWEHLKANGESFPVEVLLTHITSENGADIIHTVWRDISERKKAQELEKVIFLISQAVHSENSLKDFLKVVHNNLGKFLDTTNFYVAIYNENTDAYSFPYYKDEYDDIAEYETWSLQSSLTDYVRRKNVPLFADRKTTDELSVAGEIKLVGSDSPIWIGVPLRISRKVIGVVAVQDYHDSAKYTYRDLELLSFVADNIASAISKKLADDALKNSEIELKKLNADKDKLFTIIAHDLRAPFNSLLGSTGFLAREVEELSKVEIKEFADNINKAATNVFRLIENLLEWSRYQTGRIRYSPVEYFLKDQIDVVLELFSVNAIRKQITLTNTVSGEVKVFADKDMLDVVLRNLFSNALKYSERGGSIKIDSVEKGESIQVTVSDTGVGMNQDKINELFDMGKTGSSPGTENEKGTGLGLLLCRDFIEMNKGKIWVTSQPEQGSSFYFLIPKSLKDI